MEVKNHRRTKVDWATISKITEHITNKRIWKSNSCIQTIENANLSEGRIFRCHIPDWVACYEDFKLKSILNQIDGFIK